MVMQVPMFSGQQPPMSSPVPAASGMQVAPPQGIPLNGFSQILQAYMQKQQQQKQAQALAKALQQFQRDQHNQGQLDQIAQDSLAQVNKQKPQLGPTQLPDLTGDGGD